MLDLWVWEWLYVLCWYIYKQPDIFLCVPDILTSILMLYIWKAK